MSDLRERVCEIVASFGYLPFQSFTDAILTLVEQDRAALVKKAREVANRMHKMLLEDGCECDADQCVCGYNAAMHEWAELDAALAGVKEEPCPECGGDWDGPHKAGCSKCMCADCRAARAGVKP